MLCVHGFLVSVHGNEKDWDDVGAFLLIGVRYSEGRLDNCWQPLEFAPKKKCNVLCDALKVDTFFCLMRVCLVSACDMFFFFPGVVVRFFGSSVLFFRAVLYVFVWYIIRLFVCASYVFHLMRFLVRRVVL